MKILLIAATSFELAGIIEFLEKEGSKKNFFEYSYGEHSFMPLVTGVGSMLTAFSIARYGGQQEIDMAFNVGLAGSLPGKFGYGDVVQVISDRFADLGVEESNGGFTDIFELELEDKNNYPFNEGSILNHSIPFSSLPVAKAITINTSHGSQGSIERIIRKYDFDIESMEGAAFFYATKILDIPSYQIRAISNMIEVRNKDNWQIKLALDNLRNAMIDIIKGGFEQFPKKKSSLR